MPRGTKFGIAFLFVCTLTLATLGVAVLTAQQETPSSRAGAKVRPAEAKKSDVLTVDDMLADYEDNAAAAAKKYDEKDLTVRGKVKRIETHGAWAFVCLAPLKEKKFEDLPCRPYILCKFANRDDVTQTKRGETLTARGHCYGQPNNNRGWEIILNDCKLK